MRAQASVEYLILVGVVLVIIIPLFYYVIYQSSQNIKLNQADNSVQSIAKTADMVYSIGPGAKEQIWITIPGGVNLTLVKGNEVLIRLYVFGRLSDVYALTKANLTGSITREKGNYKIPIEMLDSGEVKIGK